MSETKSVWPVISSTSPVKFNFGAKDTSIDGYINLDIKSGHNLFEKLPYPDNSVDEIRASHLIEHQPQSLLIPTLQEWIRILKPKGILKIAVPNYLFIHQEFDKAIKGQTYDTFTPHYLMGSQSDKDDFHKSIFVPDSLRTLMEHCGLQDIKEWKSEIKDCASLPVSLNLQGTKKDITNTELNPPVIKGTVPYVYPDLFWKKPEKLLYTKENTKQKESNSEKQVSVKAIATMSMPRIAFTQNSFTAFSVFPKLGVELIGHTGAFWEQSLSKCLYNIVKSERDYDYVITVDYDSIYTQEDVKELLRLAILNPWLLAVFPFQPKRDFNTPLFAIPDYDKKTLKPTIMASEIQDELVDCAYGHFGLTVINVKQLRELPQPWLQSFPNKEGLWNEGKIDADIWFWLNSKSLGYQWKCATKVRIGHCQNIVSYTMSDLSIAHAYYKDYFDTRNKEVGEIDRVFMGKNHIKSVGANGEKITQTPDNVAISTVPESKGD